MRASSTQTCSICVRLASAARILPSNPSGTPARVWRPGLSRRSPASSAPAGLARVRLRSARLTPGHPWPASLRLEAHRQEAPEIGCDHRGGRLLAGQPVVDIGVALFQEQGVAVELLPVHRREIAVSETAENQIHLPRAAMPRPEFETLAEGLVVDGHGGRMESVLAKWTSRLRPEVLYPLFAQTTTLPGIGPRLGKLIETVAGRTVASLCWHLPTGVIDRRFSPETGRRARRA